jgi:protocatechuate 3,4-dioxygenase, alpha subunit
MKVPATTSQTVGPYFSIGLAPLYRSELASPEVAGERIMIQGRVLDGGGMPVPDAVLEIWQSDAKGEYSVSKDSTGAASESAFFGFGRIATDVNGFFQFSTIKPGCVEGPDGVKQAPHLLVSVFMRGLLNRLMTRIYFLDEPGNEKDAVLQFVDPDRRGTLLARPVGGNLSQLEWNVILQGEHETVFFEF